MAAPSERGSTAPLAGLSSTSPAGTQVGDLVIVVTFERAAATQAVHTLQSGFTHIGTSPITEASAMGLLSVGYKIATSSGAVSYQAYTSSIGTETWTGLYVFQTGTFDTNAIGLAPTVAFGTGTAAPDPPAIKLPRYTDCTVVVVGGWRLGSSLSTTVTAGANYTKKWDISAAATGDVALCTRAITSPAGATENPAIFTDNQTPTGNCAMTFWVMAPASVLEMFTIDSLGSSTDAASYVTLLGNRPAANSLAVMTAVASQASGADPPTVSSVSGWGLTWELIELDKFDSTGVTFTMEVWAAKVGSTPPANGNLTVNYSGTSTGGAIVIDNVVGLTLGATALASFKQKGLNAQGTSTSGTATLGTLGNASNLAFAAVHHDANEVITAGANFALLGNAAGTTPPKGLGTEYATNQTSCAASWTTSADYYIWAGEIAKTPAVVNTQAIAASTTVTAALARTKVKSQVIAVGTTITAALAAVKQLWENSAEGGSDTTAVTTGNSGGASGKAWDTINNGASAATTYDASPAIEGLSVAFTGGGGGSIDYLAWTGLSTTILYARAYINLTAPGSAYRLVNLMNGSTVGYDIRMQGAGGKFGLYANNVLIESAAQTPSNGAWIRLELFANAATGACEGRIFYNPNATSPDETLNGTGDTQASLTAVRFGVPTSQTFSDFNMDEFAISATDWLGPGANVPGGMTPQSVAATATFTLATLKRPTKTVPVTSAVGAALAKSARKFVAAASALGVAIGKRQPKLVAVTSAITAVLARKTGKIVPATTDLTTAVAKIRPKLVAAATALTVAIGKRQPELIAAITTVTAAVVRLPRKVIDIVVALWWPGPILAASKVSTKVVAVTMTVGAALVRRMAETVATTSAQVIVVARRAGKTVAATSPVTAALSASRKLARAVAVSTALTAAVAKRVTRSIAVGVTVTTVLTRTKVATLVIAVATTITAAVSKRVGKLLAVWTQVSPQGPALSGWTTFAGAPSFNAATGTWTMNTGDAIVSPLIPCDTPEYRLFATFLTNGPSPSVYNPNGAMLWGFNYFKGDGVTPALNTAGYTSNGNAQGLPIGVATEVSHAFAGNAGNEVRYINVIITADASWVGTGNTITIRDFMAFMGAEPIPSTPRLVMRKIGHPVAAATTFVVALARPAGKRIAATASLAVVLARKTTKTITTGITATIALAETKVATKLIDATVAVTTVLARMPRKLLVVAMPVVVSATKRMVKTVAALVAGTVVLTSTKVVTKAIAAGVSATIAIARKTGKAVNVTVAATIAAGIIKVIRKRIEIVVGALYESHITDPDAHMEIWGVRIGAETFTPQVTHLMPVVALLLHTDSIPPNPLTVELRATVGGEPSGTVLATGTIQPPGAPIAHADAVWFQAQMSPHVVVQAGTVYGLVAYTTGGDSNHDWHWIDDNTQADYTRGSEWQDVNGGGNWVQSVNQDFLFNEYGTMAALTRRTSKPVAALTSVGAALMRRTSKAVAASVVLVAAITRRITHAVAVTEAVVISVLKRAPKHIDVATTLTVAMAGIKTLMRTIAAGAAMGVAISRKTAKTLAIAITGTVILGLTKSLHWVVAVTTTITAAVTRRMARSIAVTTATVIGLLRRIPQRITASTSVTTTLSQLKVFTRAISVALSLGVGLTRRAVKQVAVTVISTVTLSLRKTVMQAVAVAVTLSVGIAKRITHALAVSTSVVVGVLRRIPQRIAASTAVAATVAGIKTFTRTIAVGMSTVAAVGRRAQKLVAVAVVAAITIGIRQILRRLVAVSVDMGAAVVRLPRKLLAVSTSLLVVLSRNTAKLLAVVVPAAAELEAGARRFVGIAVGVAMGALVDAAKPAAKLWSVTVDASVSFAVGLSRMVGKLVSVSLGLIALMGRRIINHIWPSDTDGVWPSDTDGVWPEDDSVSTYTGWPQPPDHWNE